jgi:hypothetical protein
MSRHLDEIILSQKAMLNRLGKSGARVPDERLKDLFKNDLERTMRWISEMPNFRVLTVAYGDCINEPAAVAGSLNAFLDAKL